MTAIKAHVPFSLRLDYFCFLLFVDLFSYCYCDTNHNHPEERNKMNTTIDENGAESSIQAASGDDSCWTAPLPFCCQIRVSDDHPLYPEFYVVQDINSFIGSIIYTRSCRLYFDPKVYPPPIGHADKKLSGHNQSIFELLRRDLQTAAFQSGQDIICNGSNNGKTGNIVFQCSRSRTHNTIENPKRKRHTTKPSDKEQLCYYRFTVKWDDAGYYVQLGMGCVTHRYHTKFEPEKTVKPGRLTKQPEPDMAYSICDFPDLSDSEDEGYTFYHAVKSSFESCCRAIEHDFTEDDVNRFKAFLERFVKNKKRKQHML
jgi:hypothetical protein